MTRRVQVLVNMTEVEGQMYKSGAMVRCDEKEAEKLVKAGKVQYADASEAAEREEQRRVLAARRGQRDWAVTKPAEAATKADDDQ